ncbi:MAG: hypothetical protein JO100_10175 [Pseudonocardia sp.]|nr:hypothetical protein [Pseudonocardia sp.]
METSPNSDAALDALAQIALTTEGNEAIAYLWAAVASAERGPATASEYLVEARRLDPDRRDEWVIITIIDPDAS